MYPATRKQGVTCGIRRSEKKIDVLGQLLRRAGEINVPGLVADGGKSPS